MAVALSEKQALFYFWVTVGQQMHIQGIPDRYESFEQYNQDYERQHFRYHEANQRVGASTLTLFLSWFPPPLRPLVRPLVYALMDDRMIQAFGFPTPHPWQRRFLEQLLRSRGKLLRYLPPRQAPRFYSDEPQRSYPQGYDLVDLGPPALLAELNDSLPSTHKLME